MRSKHSFSRKLFVLFAVLSSKKMAGCNPITNSDLIDHIREFSSKNDTINSTGIKTLQKEESGTYASFSPVHGPVRIKSWSAVLRSRVSNVSKTPMFPDVPDSALSSSSYSRGLLHHEHPGYTLHEYEENPPVYGYEYHAQGPAHHGFVHHTPEYYHGHGGHHDINFHHKHYDHALAAKAFLWPIAGIALLGAAAALVSNPVLLQLGVVSGRRKRRDTEEIFDKQVDAELSWLSVKDGEAEEDEELTKRLTRKRGKINSDHVNFTYKGKSHDDELKHRIPVKMYSVKQEALFKKLREHPTVQSPVEIAVDNPRRFSAHKDTNENKLIPVPLLIKKMS